MLIYVASYITTESNFTKNLMYICMDEASSIYHVYKDLWNAPSGETSTCIREQGNRNDVFAVAVESDDNIVGHIPRQILCICMHFIRRDRVLNCLITGSRWYSRDLPQGASYEEVYIDDA